MTERQDAKRTSANVQLNSMKWDLEIEELRNLSSDKKFVEDMEDIAIDVTQKFFNLYIAGMNVKNAEFNVAINDTLYILSKGRYNVGKIAENYLLQSELALANARNDLDNSQLEYQRAMEERGRWEYRSCFHTTGLHNLF